MLEKDASRQKRGEVDDYFKSQYNRFSSDHLIALLDDSEAQIRTAAAILLGKRKCTEAVHSLCKRLVKERALYSKIAISEALGDIGVPALDELIKHIAKIGKNQHKELPEETFKKWNYPLPRDIVIRTIIKMGKPALPKLRTTLQGSGPVQAAELIDAIGHISFYSGDQDSEQDLINVLERFKSNEVVVWKIIRALQAFKRPNSLQKLERYFLHSPVRELRWEAARSLGQLNAENILRKGLNDSDRMVRQMIQMSLEHIMDSKFKVR